jgi:hypothetical protein
MTTIIVDPEDSSRSGERLPAVGFKLKPIREQLDTSIDPAGQCCDLDGQPCILFADWDYGEDWSGEFVREVHPFTLIRARKISVEEFWTLVRARL